FADEHEPAFSPQRRHYGAVLTPSKRDGQDRARTGAQGHLTRYKSPRRHDGADGRGAGTAREGLFLHSALVRSHGPLSPQPTDEVRVGSGPQLGKVPKLPTTTVNVDRLEVLYQNHE